MPLFVHVLYLLYHFVPVFISDSFNRRENFAAAIHILYNHIMIRSLHQRIINTNMSAVVVSRLGISTVSSSIRAVSTVHQKDLQHHINTTCNVITNSIPRHRNYNTSTINLQKINDVHVTIESSSSSSNSTPASTKVSSGSSCSTPRLNNNNEDDNDDEEEEQEDMFVTSDPILGVGAILEHGGPRRGGTLKEPTRFGDWERKGRCTDF